MTQLILRDVLNALVWKVNVPGCSDVHEVAEFLLAELRDKHFGFSVRNLRWDREESAFRCST